MFFLLILLVLVFAPRADAFEVHRFERVEIVKPAGVFTEVPPEVLPQPGGRSLYLATDRSSRCDTSAPLLKVDCRDAVLQTYPSAARWRLSYYGVYSAERVRSRGGRVWRIVAMHGENKNQVVATGLQQNTIVPSVRAASCYSGVQPGAAVYTDCEAAYSGFIGTGRSAGDANVEPTDLGPAVWPADGYVRSGRRLSHGVRHPSIVRGGDGWVYMAYYDTSGAGGYRIARSRETDLGRRWATWVERERRWVQSVPDGEHLWARSPARSTPLWRSRGTVLTLARTIDGRFMSIEQDPGRTLIRFSRDGHSWSAPRALAGKDFTSCQPWIDSRVSYPKLLNAAATSTKVINPRDFFVLGTQYGGQVWMVRITEEGR